MIWTVVEKEIRGVITSPKFATTFATCAVLILLSIALGVVEYRAFEAQQAAAGELLDQELAEATSWHQVRGRAFRAADPLQIFVTGVHNDIGRFATVVGGADIRLKRSVFSDDPILAVFRTADLGFIVTVVLSLFAILFTYDAVSGEREQGTLQLVFSNPVPRARFIIAKFVGTWLGLALPLALPILIGLIGVVLVGVPLDGGDWARVALFVVASGLYFTVFVAGGLAVSALTRHSSSAFLVLLAVWVVVVLVVPRASLTAAAHLRPVPSAAEIEGRKAAFENAQWAVFRDQLGDMWGERSSLLEGLDEEERPRYEDQHLWEWMEEDDTQRKAVEGRISDYAALVGQELRNRAAEQAGLALSLGRVSPSSAFQLVAMGLAGTDHALKDRTEGAMREYQQEFGRFVDDASGGRGGERRIIARRSNSGGRFSFVSDDGDNPVDLTAMPVFEMPERPFERSLAEVLPDLGLLAALALLGFTVAFVGFLRRDIR